MIILAFDSTAVTATVALLDNEDVIGVSSVHNKLTHSEKLLPMTDELLKNSGYSIDDVELLAVSRGPGSFTGVRIGISTVKGISFAKNLPVAGVSSLEALAENVKLSTPLCLDKVIVCPCMDARRNELYNALFLYDGKTLERITEDRAISCEEVGEELSQYNFPVLINGDGAEKFYDFLCSADYQGKFFIAPELLVKQNAVSVGKIAYRMFLENNLTDGEKITPLYLRTSQAERVNNKENKL